MNHDSFFKSKNESRIDNSRKFENRAYPTAVAPGSPAFRAGTRAGTIHDSKNPESIQNPDFQVNRELTIRQNQIIILIKELIQELRIDTKSRI